MFLKKQNYSPSASNSRDNIIRNCAAMVARLLYQRHVTFNIAPGDIKMRRIVINLPSNAIRHTRLDSCVAPWHVN